MRWRLLLVLSLLWPTVVAAEEPPIIHDAEHYVLLDQLADRWGQEDAEINEKLAGIRGANGGKAPNIVYILLDDLGFGEIGMPDLDVIRG